MTLSAEPTLTAPPWRPCSTRATACRRRSTSRSTTPRARSTGRDLHAHRVQRGNLDGTGLETIREGWATREASPCCDTRRARSARHAETDRCPRDPRRHPVPVSSVPSARTGGPDSDGRRRCRPDGPRGVRAQLLHRLRLGRCCSRPLRSSSRPGRRDPSPPSALRNGVVSKLVLVATHSWRTVIRFGVPAIVAAIMGARVLLWLSDLGSTGDLPMLDNASSS